MENRQDRPSLGYLAGIFDIAGTIRIEYSKTLKEWILLLRITHPSFRLMEIFQKLGAYIVKLQNGLYRAKWRKERANKFLQLIYPFLILKQNQAQLAIEYFSHKDLSDKEHVIYQAKLRLLKRNEMENKS